MNTILGKGSPENSWRDENQQRKLGSDGLLRVRLLTHLPERCLSFALNRQVPTASPCQQSVQMELQARGRVTNDAVSVGNFSSCLKQSRRGGKQCKVRRRVKREEKATTSRLRLATASAAWPHAVETTRRTGRTCPVLQYRIVPRSPPLQSALAAPRSMWWR